MVDMKKAKTSNLVARRRLEKNRPALPSLPPGKANRDGSPTEQAKRDEIPLCRKPRLELLVKRRSAQIDLAKSFMIGDRWQDADCGFDVGCKSALVDWDCQETLKRQPDYGAGILGGREAHRNSNSLKSCMDSTLFT
jgi:hypothetical protein